LTIAVIRDPKASYYNRPIPRRDALCARLRGGELMDLSVIQEE
jgi:hypothetical protein